MMHSIHRVILFLSVAIILLSSPALTNPTSKSTSLSTIKTTAKSTIESTSHTTPKSTNQFSTHSTTKTSKPTTKPTSKSTSKSSMSSSKATTKLTTSKTIKPTSSTSTSTTPTSTPSTICAPNELAVGYGQFCVYGHCDEPVGTLWDYECDDLASATGYNAESNDYCFVSWNNGASVECIDTGSEYLPVNITVVGVDGETEKFGDCRDVDVQLPCGGDQVAADGSTVATQVNFCCVRV